jgi:hypothetical protein
MKPALYSLQNPIDATTKENYRLLMNIDENSLNKILANRNHNTFKRSYTREIQDGG